MATTVAKLTAILDADTRRFDSGMKKSESTFSRLGKVSGLAGAAIVTGVVAGLGKAVGAAKEAQVSQVTLEQAMKGAGLSYDTHRKAIEKVIDKTSKLAALDDEDLQDTFSRLVRTTGSVQKATEGMALSADIARGRHISLEAASKAVEKALLGQTTGLKRLGVAVDPVSKAQDALKVQMDNLKLSIKDASGAEKEHLEAQLKALEATKEVAKARDKQATADNAIALAQRKYKDAAKDYGETGAAANEKLSVAFENLQEKIGQKVVPILAKLTLALVDVIEWLEKNWPQFEKAFQQAADAVQAAYVKIKPIIDNIFKYVKGLVDLVVGIFSGDWSRAWKGLTEIVSGAFGALKALLSLELELLGKAMKAIGVHMLNDLKEGLTGIGNAAGSVIDNIGQWINDHLNQIKQWGENVGTNIKNAVINTLLGIGAGAWAIVNNIGEFITERLGAIYGWGKNAGEKVKQGIIDGITGIGKWVVDRVNEWANTIGSLPGKVLEALKGGADTIKEAVLGLFDKLPGAVKKLLGISSPSSVFADIGRNIIAGLIKGLEDAGPALLAKAGDLATKAADVLAGGSAQAGTGLVTGNAASNALLGRQMAAARGWTGQQWEALFRLFTGESGWSNTAMNASSGAYGIPQALPASKLPGAGQASGGSDPAAQIGWGLNYIASRYGNPVNAYNAWLSRSPHWYAKGGLFTRPSIIGVGEAGPEAVIPLNRVAPTINVTVNGWVGNDQQIAQRVRQELLKDARRNARGII